MPFYRRRWENTGLDPGVLRGVEDLERIPLLSAREARAAINGSELVARGVDRDALPSFPSSGSSGGPLEVGGPVEQRLWRAVALRTWLEHGTAGPTSPFSSTRSRPLPTPCSGSACPGRSGSPPASSRTRVERILSASPEVLAGTPTALRRLARALDGRRPAPRIVFSQGASRPATVTMVERVFGTTPVGLYGLTEVGYVGWQCERRGGYHLNADAFLVEVLRDGGRTAGRLGDLVVTDLRGRTAPLIRYRTGDLATAGDGPCPCGRALPLLRSWRAGRGMRSGRRTVGW